MNISFSTVLKSISNNFQSQSRQVSFGMSEEPRDSFHKSPKTVPISEENIKYIGRMLAETPNETSSSREGKMYGVLCVHVPRESAKNQAPTLKYVLENFDFSQVAQRQMDGFFSLCSYSPKCAPDIAKVLIDFAQKDPEKNSWVLKDILYLPVANQDDKYEIIENLSKAPLSDNLKLRYIGQLQSQASRDKELFGKDLLGYPDNFEDAKARRTLLDAIVKSEG